MNNDPALTIGDLYETDVLTWSEQQAELLHRRAAGELVNDKELDWSNIAEEIQEVGKSSLRAVRSHILQALLHELKTFAWPRSRDVPHWTAEARLRLDQARDDYVPSMASKIDVAKLYKYSQAQRALPATMDGQPPQPLPSGFRVTLAEMMAPPPDESNDDGE